MTKHQPLVIDSGVAPRDTHPLREWRKRQLFLDKASNCRRAMRLEDVTEAYGIPSSTWHCWERWPGEKGFRRPDDENMKRLFTITKGEITPNLFYPVEAWAAELSEADS